MYQLGDALRNLGQLHESEVTYRNAVGRFDQRPRRAESVCPVTAAPAIFGAARLWGGRILPAREVPAKSTRARSSTPLIEPDRFIALAGTYIGRGGG